jgi:hypothetical protein
MTSTEGLRDAIKIVTNFEQVAREKTNDMRLYWRLVSGQNAFVTGLKAPLLDTRLHQFVRAIESFLPREKRMGNRRFAERAKQLLACPGNPETPVALQQIYKLRSSAEHHLWFESALPKVKNAVELAMRRTRQAESLARELYQRFFTQADDNLRYFAHDEALAELWEHPSDLKRIWGAPFDLHSIT